MNCVKIFTKENLGFSLTELVITISIIIILSAIVGPIYRSYASNARLSEGYALAGTIRSAQDQFFSEHNYYYWNFTYTCYDETLGIDARPNKYYTAFRPGTDIWGGNTQNKWFRTDIIGKGVPTIIYIHSRTSGTTVSTKK
ncbi:MAG: hypothetical protein II816_05020 [Elusimicrobia bacterium]|nr:hypothetical protein [Elusimicrobiota bacterium]